MPEISKIKTTNGTVYDIKDTVARATMAGAILIKGTTTTALTDQATTTPIKINNADYTPKANDAVFYNKKEFIFDGTKWHEFGDMTGLGALATKDSASGSFTPAGTVSQPTFTGTQKSVSVSGKPTGSVTISTGTGTANYTPSGTVSKPTFSGTATTSSGKFTPAGTISAANNTSGNYTPAGTVGAPTISVATAGATTTVNSITNVGTLPTLSTTVEDETLVFNFSQGTLPTKGADTTVKTGDASYSASAPSFTGTKVKLSFTGTEGNVSVSGTPTGTVSQPTFTGDGTELKATFSGTSFTSTGNYTPEGTVSQPTFSGTQGTVSVS